MIHIYLLTLTGFLVRVKNYLADKLPAIRFRIIKNLELLFLQKRSGMNINFFKVNNVNYIQV
jgi:hypothetical protein